MDPHDPPDPRLCRHLRCKGMYVPRGSEAPDPVFSGDTTSWWCDRTSYAVGPDHDWVHRTACLPGRGCHEPPPKVAL